MAGRIQNSEELLLESTLQNLMKTKPLLTVRFLAEPQNTTTLLNFSQPARANPRCARPRRQRVEPRGVRRQQPAAGHGRHADAGEARVAAEQEPWAWRKSVALLVAQHMTFFAG